MRNLIVIVGAFLLLGACSKSKADQAISEMAGFKDEMCKCTDKACAEKVQKDMRAAGEKYKDMKEDGISDDAKAKMKDTMKEMRECEKKAKHGGEAAKMAEAMTKMTGFKDSMCKCADKACADKVQEDMTKWGTEMAKSAAADMASAPSPEDSKKMADTMKEYGDCMAKASTK